MSASQLWGRGRSRSRSPEDRGHRASLLTSRAPRAARLVSRDVPAGCADCTVTVWWPSGTSVLQTVPSRPFSRVLRRMPSISPGVKSSSVGQFKLSVLCLPSPGCSEQQRRGDALSCVLAASECQGGKHPKTGVPGSTGSLLCRCGRD